MMIPRKLINNMVDGERTRILQTGIQEIKRMREEAEAIEEKETAPETGRNKTLPEGWTEVEVLPEGWKGVENLPEGWNETGVF